MQVALVLDKSERKSAEALEPAELVSNLTVVGDSLRFGVDELYEGFEPWLAYYALTCANVLRSKGYKTPLDQSELMAHRPDNAFRPRWVDKFIKAHRSYCVLMGWIRYFNERKATGTVLREHGLMSLIEMVNTSEGPRDLDSRFKDLDGFCNKNGFAEAKRPYRDLTDFPAAFKLHP